MRGCLFHHPLDACGCELHFEWVRGNQNQLADDLIDQDSNTFPVIAVCSLLEKTRSGWSKVDSWAKQRSFKAQEFEMELAEEKKRKVSEPKTNKKNRRSWILSDFLC